MVALRTLAASTLLTLPVCAVAAPGPSSSFKIELELINPNGMRTSFPVRCLAGCDWEEMIIACPDGENVCRATIEARLHSDPAQDRPQEVRPISGTVCTGVATTSLEHALDSGLRTGEPSRGENGRVVAKVMEGSPAERAGVKVGDLLVTFNAVPVTDGAAVLLAIQSMAPGQAFEMTLDRNGAPIQVSGTLGMRTTARTCVPADARLLETAAVTPEELTVPFELVIDAPKWKFRATCVEGCAWSEASLGASGPDFMLRRPIVVDEDDLRPMPPSE